MTRITKPAVAPRPTSRPPVWRRPRQRRGGYRRPQVDTRRRMPNGVLTFWTRARRLFWSWWPWAFVSIWAIGDARWGWAFGAGAMAIVSYLIAPAAEPPRFGLDHEFSIDSPEFVGTVAGASGSPFLAGNNLELLNNGDAFYPPMLAARSPTFDHDRGVLLLARYGTKDVSPQRVVPRLAPSGARRNRRHVAGARQRLHEQISEGGTSTTTEDSRSSRRC
jgi:hypothetical protein